MNPKITVLLCTVRDDAGYLEHPEWTTLGKVLDDLSQQTFQDFELVIVDGLATTRYRENGGFWPTSVKFPVVHVPPRQNLWTRNKKVAISTFRNTGLAWARGELVANLDDCCVLPPMYLELFWTAWKHHKVCAAATWPKRGDWRKPGMVGQPGIVYGFGSYPLEAALTLNGYDEAYDGGQGLEDGDWSTRLFHLGVRMALLDIPGFDIEPQSKHSSRAIDLERPLVKCCNAAYYAQRMWRQVKEANREELWTPEALRLLVGPCHHLHGEMCGYHLDRNRCAYLDAGFATALDPLAAKIFDEPPIFDLAKERKLNGL